MKCTLLLLRAPLKPHLNDYGNEWMLLLQKGDKGTLGARSLIPLIARIV